MLKHTSTPSTIGHLRYDWSTVFLLIEPLPTFDSLISVTLNQIGGFLRSNCDSNKFNGSEHYSDNEIANIIEC